MSPAPSASSRSAACRPIALASARVPRALARTARVPSGATTAATSSSSSVAFGTASAPIGRLTASAENRDQLPLGFECGSREVVVDWRDRSRHLVVAGPDLDRNDALSRRRDAPFRRQRQRDSRGKAETAQSRRRQHDRVIAHPHPACASECRDCRGSPRSGHPGRAAATARRGGRCRSRRSASGRAPRRARRSC